MTNTNNKSYRKSKIVKDAILDMLDYLVNEKGISEIELAKSGADCAGQVYRKQDFDDLREKPGCWEASTLEKYLLCDAVDEDAIKYFTNQLAELSLFYKNPPLVEKNAELEDAVLGGSQGRKKLRSVHFTHEQYQQARAKMDSIGRNGEEFINFYLNDLQDRDKINSFEWISDSKALSDHDFCLRMGTDETSKILIDVKSTLREFERKIHISWGELQRMSSGTERYDIYRIYEIDENNRTAKLRIAEEVRSFAKMTIEVLSRLPEGVFADGISIDLSKSVLGLDFQPEIEIQLPDEPKEESEDIYSVLI